jgi:Uncharacterized conserved protein
MIFVAVGTRKFQLNRLLKKLDELVESGLITDEVYAQIGYSDYKPQHYRYIDFLPQEQFNAEIEKCDLLITHGGVGIILAGLKARKSVIVFPRLAKYGEHVDDHQLEITEAFVELNYVLQCLDVHDLAIKLNQSYNIKFSEYCSKREKVISFLEDYINENL